MTDNRGTQLVSIPIRFHLRSVKLNWQIVHDGDTAVFAGSWPGGAMENIDLGDGWELVRGYLSVSSQNEQQVREFLVAHGRVNLPDEFSETARVNKRQTPVGIARPEHGNRHGEQSEVLV